MNPEQYIQSYGTAAQAASAKTGIPASTILAQSALESGWGGSGLTQKFFNFFGIKADSSWSGEKAFMPTGEYVNGKPVVSVDAFRVYNSAEESFLDWVSFLLGMPRYKNVPKASDGYAAADALQAAGYATDPNYASKLKSIIKKYNLTSLDSGAKTGVDAPSEYAGQTATQSTSVGAHDSGLTTAAGILPSFSLSSFTGIFTMIIIILILIGIVYLLFKLAGGNLISTITKRGVE